MKVLVACEFSGAVRDAFAARGHDATSCDLLAPETPGKHHQGDVFDLDLSTFDMMIAHPPCTHLAVSGARWWPIKRAEQAEAVAFVKRLLAAPVKRIALENPVGLLSTVIRPAEQIIQPWEHGHGETKATCLWLKGLPPSCPPTSSPVGWRGRIWKAQGLTGGHVDRAPCRASLRPWPSNGAAASTGRLRSGACSI